MTPNLNLVIFFGIFSLLILFIGWKRDFFSWKEERPLIPLRWFHLILVFSIYFFVTILVLPLLVVFLQNLIPSTPPIALACWLTFLMSFFILSGILSYCYFLPKEISLAIWNSSKKISLSQDIYTAVIFCIIAFPLMIFFAAFFDWILYFLFNIKEIPEQLAVLFLKMSIGYPFYFFLNMITVVILAPCIEETLFRGFLQSYLKQYFSTKMSIVGTSLSFAFFHYSSEQGIANLSIIGSLFVLALFLGFIYEKRKSLLAPMILHALFNMINIIHLYLSEGFIHT